MCKDFYKKRIIDAGIEVLLPKRIDEVNAIIYDELCKGVVLNQSKEKLLKIIAELKTQGAQGVILGCTELDLLVKPEDGDLPVYDTTFIHSQEAAYRALGKE
jgi:aspartate racemase